MEEIVRIIREQRPVLLSPPQPGDARLIGQSKDFYEQQHPTVHPQYGTLDAAYVSTQDIQQHQKIDTRRHEQTTEQQVEIRYEGHAESFASH